MAFRGEMAVPIINETKKCVCLVCGLILLHGFNIRLLVLTRHTTTQRTHCGYEEASAKYSRSQMAIPNPVFPKPVVSTVQQRK